MKYKKIVAELLFAVLLTATACGSNAGTVENPVSVTDTELNWQEQYNLGMRYLEEGNYEQAIVAFTAAIEIDPKQAVIYIGRAQAYIRSGETEENLAAALADYESALELDEKNSDIYLGLADVYIRQGNYEKAIQILKAGFNKIGDSRLSDKLNEMDGEEITDSDGNIRRQQAYNADGALLWYHEFTYGVDGKKTSVTSYDSKGNQTGYLEVLYDEQGREIQSYVYAWDTGVLCKTEFQYDENGNCIREDTYDEAGNLSYYIEDTYDTAGKNLTSNMYEADGTWSSRDEYEYDDQGRYSKITTYFLGGDSEYAIYQYEEGSDSFWIYEYDSAGNLQGYDYHEIDADGNSTKVIFYDADGNELEY